MSQGKLDLTPLSETLLVTALAYLSKLSLEDIQKAIRTAERAESVGPILHPSAWTGEAYKRHLANLDVLRRVEDLLRAVKELEAASTAVPSNLS